MACHAMATSPWWSPAASRPSSLARPRSSSRSSASVSSRRQRYSGSSLRPRWPRVSFCTRRRTSLEALVRQLDEPERIGDLRGVGQHHLERQPPHTATGPTQPTRSHHATVSAGQRANRTRRRRCVPRPRQGVGRPRRRRSTWTTPGFATAPGGRTAPHPAERGDSPDPVGVVHQRRPVGDHGVIDRVPISAKVRRHVFDRAATATGLLGRPPAGTVRHCQARRGDCGHILSPRPPPDTTRSGSASGACATPGASGARSTAGPPTPRPGGPSPTPDRRTRRSGAAPDSSRCSKSPDSTGTRESTYGGHRRCGTGNCSTWECERSPSHRR